MLNSISSKLGGGISRAAGFLGGDKYLGVKTNYWKPAALGLAGAAVGIGALAYFRPTYTTAGGDLITQNAQDPISGAMNSMMPLLMMMMMIPMMSGLAKSAQGSNDEKGDN
jgi:membrane protein insertase Oxa1/YidC/SpoIIIJ